MKKIKSYEKYPKSLKRKVAEEYLSGKFSYAIAAEEYGLSGKGVVKEFVKWYRRNYDIESMSKNNPLPESKAECEGGSKTVLSSSGELDRLQKELAAAKLKIAGLEALIDVAEQELKVDIRKKSGTKQSK